MCIYIIHLSIIGSDIGSADKQHCWMQAEAGSILAGSL